MEDKKSKFLKYLGIETVGGPTWAPNGKEIAFVYNSPGQFQVYKTMIQEDIPVWPSRISYSENRSTNPYYLKDGTLLFNRDNKGDENFQLILLDTNSQVHHLSKDPQAKYLITHVNDEFVYYASNETNKARFDVYRWKLPLTQNNSEFLFESSHGLMIVNTANKENTKLIVSSTLGNMHQELFLFDLETKELQPLTQDFESSRNNRWRALKWLDDTHILVTTDYNHEFMRLGILTLNKQFLPWEEFLPPFAWDITEITLEKDSSIIYFTINEHGYSKLYQVTATPQGFQNLLEIPLPFPGVITSGDVRSFTKAMSVSPDNSYLAVSLSSPTNPMNIWVYNLKTKHWWKASNGNTSGIPKSSFVEPVLEKVKSFDGLEIPYFKYVPHGEPPKQGWPTLLIIHGGPEAQSIPVFSAEIQFFLSNGFLVIVPNIRGSSGYGRTYLDLDNKEKRLDAIKDIKHLAIALQSMPEVNADQLIIFGGSYGGFAVLSALTEHPDLWKAGIDIVGISNFVTFLQNTAAWRRKLRETEYGSLEHDYELLKRISPINHVDKIKAPLFIIQGDNDERVPLSESLQIYEKVKQKGIPVRLLRFADEGHGITKLQNKIEAYTQVLEWLNEILSS